MTSAHNNSIPATPLQQGMVFHAVAHPNTGVDIEQVAITCDQRLESDAIRQAFELVAMRYPILRTRFDWSGATTDQIVEPSVHVSTVSEQWSPDQDIKALISERKTSDRMVDFDLSSAPLQRLFVANIESRTWILWSFHHSLLDGRSFPVVLSEAFDVLDGVELHAPSAVDFGEFAQAVRAQDTTEANTFWSEYLAPISSPTSIGPLRGLEADPVSGPAVAGEQSVLSRAATSKLRAAAFDHGVTLNTMVQAAWLLLLHHYSQESQVTTGITRARRHLLDNSADTVGLLINTVPLTIEITPDLTVAQLLQTVGLSQRRIRVGETLPLPSIQEVSGLGSTPMFDNIIMYDDATLDTRMKALDPERYTARHFEYTGQTNFDLTLLAYGEDEMLLRLEYQRAAHSGERAATILAQLEAILAGLAEAPERAAVALEYMTDAELTQLDNWNNSHVPYDLSKPLHEIFQDQVARTPDAPALTIGDKSLSYSQFNAEANRLADHLVSQGVGPDKPVGVCAKRSFEMMIGIYAVLKAGGAYVPLDPNNPPDRTAFMIADAGVELVLAQNEVLDRLSGCGQPIIDLNLDAQAWADCSPANLNVVVEPSNLAYILFTSGSTGRPKGAMNEHRGIVNRLLWMQDGFAIDSTDTVLQKTPYSFDVSVWELFWPLQVGARLEIAPPDAHRDPAILIGIIRRAAVTTMHFVPSMLQLFLEDNSVSTCNSLKRVICSGEALTRNLQDRFYRQLPKTELHNLYGPTEAAIDVTWWACDPTSDRQSVPIGRTIANTQMHVLDPQLRRLPLGVAGELHIGGVQVGRGYVNREDLTAERFLPDPFNGDPARIGGARLYKTGDLARMDDDGIIEYLGRLDFQVKLRGLRIELGEIEAVISAHDSVREVVVSAHGPAGEERLVAYLVGESPEPDLIQKHTAQYLAPYMIPADWVVLDEFPLNSSGKVNRKKLPAPTVNKATTLLAPTSATEKRVTKVWSEILGSSDLSIDQPFFAMGGNSLGLVRLASQLSAEFQVDIRVPQLLRKVTIGDQANMVDDLVSSGRSQSADVQAQSGSETGRKQREARNKRARRRK